MINRVLDTTSRVASMHHASLTLGRTSDEFAISLSPLAKLLVKRQLVILQPNIADGMTAPIVDASA